MMKKFLNSLFFLLLICLIPIGVSAKESSITIDFTKTYVDGKNIDQIQEEALTYLINSGEVTLLNNVDIDKLEYGLLFESKYQDTTFMAYADNDGKILLLYDVNNNYIVPVGVGFNDNIHVNIDKSSNLKYDYIDIVFGEKKSKDKYLVLQLVDDMELSNLSLKDTSIIKILLEKSLLEEQEDYVITNNKGKKLFYLNDNQKKLIVERGLNYKDDIIYDLTKEDKELINEYLGINSNYKQIKLILANDSRNALNSPKTFNIIIFPLAVFALSIVIMAFYIYKNKREN